MALCERTAAMSPSLMVEDFSPVRRVPVLRETVQTPLSRARVRNSLMDDLDLCFMPATELALAIKAKKISPVEVTRAVIARIEVLEPKLNAFARR